jgi:hypothetical protein
LADFATSLEVPCLVGGSFFGLLLLLVLTFLPFFFGFRAING